VDELPDYDLLIKQHKENYNVDTKRNTLSEEDIIAQAQEAFGDLDDYVRIGNPGVLMSALWAFSMNGMADDQSGNVESPTNYFERIHRWILVTDDRGFSDIETYDNEAEAIEAFNRRDEEYCQWAGDDE
jgi:hypothetical protein